MYLNSEGESGRIKFISSQYDTIEYSVNDSNLYNLNSYNDDNFERAYIRLMNGYLIHLEDTNYIMAMFERNLRRIHVENTLSTTTNNNERQRQSYQSYLYQNNNPNHNTNHNEPSKHDLIIHNSFSLIFKTF